MSRYIRVTRGTPGKLNSEGLEPLRMALWENNKEVQAVTAYSGAPGRQNFRTLAQERRGVLEPCPEGIYRQIGGLEWAGKVDDYSASWAAGLGPVVIEVYGERAIMIHLDANRSFAPGSAGCLCPIDLNGLKTVVSWWKAGKPDWVECDWGLGTILSPTATPAVASHRVKLFAKPGKYSAFYDGIEQKAMSLKFDYHTGKLGLALNGVQKDEKSILGVTVEVVYKS